MESELIFSKEQLNLTTLLFRRNGRILFRGERRSFMISDIGIREEQFVLPVKRTSDVVSVVVPVYRITGAIYRELALNGIIRAPITLLEDGSKLAIFPPEFHYALRLGGGSYLGTSVGTQDSKLLVTAAYTTNFDIKNVNVGFNVKQPTIAVVASFTAM